MLRPKYNLTLFAEELRDMALLLLNDAEEIRLIMQDRAEEKRLLMLGAPNMTYVAGFPDFFQILHRAYPDMEIQTVHDITANLLPQLYAGKLHLLMVPYKPAEERCRYMVWKKTRFLFCVSSKHPLAELEANHLPLDLQEKYLESLEKIIHEPVDIVIPSHASHYPGDYFSLVALNDGSGQALRVPNMWQTLLNDRIRQAKELIARDRKW